MHGNAAACVHIVNYALYTLHSCMHMYVHTHVHVHYTSLICIISSHFLTELSHLSLLQRRLR